MPKGRGAVSPSGLAQQTARRLGVTGTGLVRVMVRVRVMVLVLVRVRVKLG